MLTWIKKAAPSALYAIQNVRFFLYSIVFIFLPSLCPFPSPTPSLPFPSSPSTLNLAWRSSYINHFLAGPAFLRFSFSVGTSTLQLEVWLQLAWLEAAGRMWWHRVWCGLGIHVEGSGFGQACTAHGAVSSQLFLETLARLKYVTRVVLIPPTTK